MGIDAADPDYINRRIEAGGLPNFNALGEKGIRCRMRSTFPVLSSAAWSTISTGLPPEGHGIYEFFRRKPGTWIDEPVLGGNKQGDNYWEIVARHGLKTVTINVPMTYPPQPVNGGVVISGMDSPGEASAFVTPASEKAALMEAVPDYRIEITAAQFHSADDFIEAISKQMEARMRATEFLLERYHPDLATVIFTALDRVLHALWKYVDPAHPAYHATEASQWRNQIDRLYDQVDDYLGRLVDWAGPEAITLVTSDHGGAAVHGIFYLNRWLAQEGYLSIKTDAKFETLKRADKLQSWIKRNVPREVKNIFNRFFPNLHTSVGTRLGLSVIDPEKTKLYGWRKAEVLRVNLAGREPGGMVQPGEEYRSLIKEVKNKLEALVDPRNGRKPIRKVWMRHEAYPLANRSADCPDLVIEWGDYLYDCDTTLEDLHGVLFTTEEKIGEPFGVEVNGKHALHGVFGIRGPGINSQCDLDVMNIIDIAPTVLTALGMEIPAAMPGSPPEQLFSDKTPKKAQPITAEGKFSSDRTRDLDTGDQSSYSKEEQEIIEKRLRDLGYL